MVEAAGIEPASEDIQQKLSTCISSSLISSSGARRGKAPKNQPQEHFTHQVQGAPGSLSCSSTLLKNRRRELEKRHAYFLGSEWLCFCTYLGPPFYEVDGISTCSFYLTIPVESVRPHTQVNIIFARVRLVNTPVRGISISVYMIQQDAESRPLAPAPQGTSPVGSPRQGSGLGSSARSFPQRGNSLRLILRSSLPSVEKPCPLSLRRASSPNPLASSPGGFRAAFCIHRKNHAAEGAFRP